METTQTIAQRWSPRAYLSDAVSAKDIATIFEAAITAHSCFNEQPWRFLFATKDAGAPREQLEALLDNGNAFAKQPWVLGLVAAKKTFTKTGKPNRHAGYDSGSAAQLMSLQATALGLGMRFMAGFNAQSAAKLMPADFEPYAMFVIGVPQPELARPKRDRHPVPMVVFENVWENGFKI